MPVFAVPESRDSSMAPYRLLALHVLDQAMKDATGSPYVAGARNHECREQRIKDIKRRATTWIESRRYYPWDAAAGVTEAMVIDEYERRRATP